MKNVNFKSANDFLLISHLHFMKRVRGCPGRGYSKILNRGALLTTHPCQGRVPGKDRGFPLVREIKETNVNQTSYLWQVFSKSTLIIVNHFVSLWSGPDTKVIFLRFGWCCYARIKSVSKRMIDPNGVWPRNCKIELYWRGEISPSRLLNRRWTV